MIDGGDVFEIGDNEAIPATRVVFTGRKTSGRSNAPPRDDWYTFFALGEISLAMSVEETPAPIRRTIYHSNQHVV